MSANTNNPILNVDGSVSISANGGNLVAPPSSNFTVAKNFTNNGTFDDNGGTVIFDTTNTSVLDGSSTPAITFTNFSSTTQNKTLSFTQGKTFKVNGLFTITGALSNEITMGSTTSTRWLIDLQGTSAVTYVALSNSGCAGGTLDVDLDNTATNDGNNGTCWAFPPPPSNATLRGGATIRGGTTLKQLP